MTDSSCRHAEMVPARMIVEDLGPHENSPGVECWRVFRTWTCAKCGREAYVDGNVSFSTEMRTHWQALHPNDEWGEVVRRLYDEGGPLTVGLPPVLAEIPPVE